MLTGIDNLSPLTIKDGTENCKNTFFEDLIIAVEYPKAPVTSKQFANNLKLVIKPLN